MKDATAPLRKLVESVYLATISQQLTWSYNPSTDSCISELGSGYVEVVQESNDEGDYFSYIQIKNNQQEVVDTIYGGSLGKGNRPFNTAHKDYWELMKDLRAQAYRAAMGSDKIVATMLTALNATDLSLDEDVPF